MRVGCGRDFRGVEAVLRILTFLSTDLSPFLPSPQAILKITATKSYEYCIKLLLLLLLFLLSAVDGEHSNY
jgi:hypothetical protein